MIEEDQSCKSNAPLPMKQETLHQYREKDRLTLKQHQQNLRFKRTCTTSLIVFAVFITSTRESAPRDPVSDRADADIMPIFCFIAVSTVAPSLSVYL